MVFFSMSIQSPKSIAGDYDVAPAEFGMQWTEGILTGPFVDCGDCSKVMRRRDVYRRVALCRRSTIPGAKSDHEMAMLVQTNYALAMIVIMDNRGDLVTMKLPLGKTDRIQIPCLCVGREDGQAIIRAMEDKEVVVSLVGGVRDIWAFGNGKFGQLGLSQHLAFQSVERPTMAIQEKGILMLACGANHSLALLDSGQVFSWGFNENGEVGNGTNTACTSPYFMESLSQWRIKGIACGANHNLAIADPFQANGDGCWSWGINDFCQLGHSSGTQFVTEPKKIPEMEARNVIMVAAGFFHSMCVVTNYIMSASEKAEKRNAKKMEKEKERTKPTDKMPAWLKKSGGDPEKAAGKAAKKVRRKQLIKLEDERSRMQRDDNEMRTLYTWGDGGKGQLGHRELYTEAYFQQSNPKGAAAVAKLRKFTRLECPRLVEGIVGWCTPKEYGHITKIKANGCQSGLLTTKGCMMVWGCGENGRLGTGNTKCVTVPSPVTGLRINKLKKEESKVVDFAIGQFSMICLTESGDVFCWGKNSEGQLGLGDDGKEGKDVLEPFPSKGLSKRAAHSVFCGNCHGAMVTSNGEIFIWGKSEGGRLGLVDPPDIVHDPVCLETMHGVEVASVALGAGHTLALTDIYPADDTSGRIIATSIMTDGKVRGEGHSMVSACCVIG